MSYAAPIVAPKKSEGAKTPTTHAHTQNQYAAPIAAPNKFVGAKTPVTDANLTTSDVDTVCVRARACVRACVCARARA